jgi:hypothetical protein
MAFDRLNAKRGMLPVEGSLTPISPLGYAYVAWSFVQPSLIFWFLAFAAFRLRNPGRRFVSLLCNREWSPCGPWYSTWPFIPCSSPPATVMGRTCGQRWFWGAVYCRSPGARSNLYDNMPESLQQGEKGTTAENAADALGSAATAIEEAISYLSPRSSG